MLTKKMFLRNNFVLLATVRQNIYKASCSRKYSKETGKTKNYDIIIAGGGMVGCTLACSLGRSPLLSHLRILLLEGSPSHTFTLKEEYSNRVVALNQNTKALMKSLDVWPHIEKVRVQPVKHMQVWDACSDALITFSSMEMLDEDVAYIVENDLLLQSVTKELEKNTENVTIEYGAKVTGYELPNDISNKSIVKMSNGDTYSCKLLLGADGAKSAVREAMAVPYMSWDYDQMGVVATVYLSETMDNTTAWQRFLPTGPVALLPLDSKRSSLVWSTTQEHAKYLLKLPEEQFVDELNDALWKQYPRSGGVEACTSFVGDWLRRAGLPDGAARQLPPSADHIVSESRAAFPLAFGHSARYVAPGVALLGDAAHRVHPLAGQGVNLGFGDVKELSELLSDAVYSGLEIDHHSWLEKYESQRQRHNVPTQFVIDALHRLYTVDFAPVVLIRSVGLQLTNALLPIKKMIFSHAAA